MPHKDMNLHKEMAMGKKGSYMPKGGGAPKTKYAKGGEVKKACGGMMNKKKGY